MSDLNKKNINYGALNRFYQNLKSHDISTLNDKIDNIVIPEYVAGEGITIDSANTISCTVKPITNVSTLPDAEENKDSVLRLEGDKQVYISKGNPITPTNRVPDDEQIGRAAISEDGGYEEYHGEYTITCADGVLHWYRWGDTEHFYITEDDAEHTIDSTKAFFIDTDDSKYSNITESSITTTDNKSVIESSSVTVATIDAGMSFPMPVTYKMPEETQIGNAFIETTYGDLFFYTGEEVDFEFLSRQYTGYKWVNVDRTTFEPNENLFKISLRKAEDLTYYNTGGDAVYCNTYIYTSNNGTITEDYYQYNMGTINRNAADAEQVGNAYIYYNPIGYFYYTGELATINGVSGYKWEISNHSDFIITVGVKAEDLYTNKFRLEKGEIPVYINSTSSEIDYSRLDSGYETVQYKRSVDYLWKRVVTEDDVTEQVIEGSATLVYDNSMNITGISGVTFNGYTESDLLNMNDAKVRMIFNIGFGTITQSGFLSKLVMNLGGVDKPMLFITFGFMDMASQTFKTLYMVYDTTASTPTWTVQL